MKTLYIITFCSPIEFIYHIKVRLGNAPLDLVEHCRSICNVVYYHMIQKIYADCVERGLHLHGDRLILGALVKRSVWVIVGDYNVGCILIECKLGDGTNIYACAVYASRGYRNEVYQPETVIKKQS